MILRVLDAFRPRGATRSGQVISSPGGPSGGPSKTHLLPGGGVPGVHRARSPVLPRLPRFSTPRSVHQFAALAAGAYPLRCPPNAWSPGAPAPPGPCYWLVASGTPLGWRGGCLAYGLGRGAVRHYCLGRYSALSSCARFGGFGPVPGVVSLSFPRPRPACSALRVAGRPVRVSLTLARWYAIPRGLCVPRAQSGCPSGSPRVSLSCVRARALAVSAPLPLGGVACAPRVVPALGAGRAVWSGPCPSACPAPVPCSVWRAWRGGGPVLVPPYLAWGCGGGSRASPGGVPSTIARGVWGHALPLPRLPAHWAGCRGPRSTCCGRGRAGVGALLCPLGRHALWRLRAAGRVRGVHVLGGGLGGGGACAVPPGCAARGGACRAGGRSASFRPSAFPGQATKRASLPLCCPWGAWPPIPLRFVLSRLLWVPSVRRPGAQARARLFFAAPMGAGGWGGGAGCAPAPLSGGGGAIPPASGVGGRGPRGPRASGGAGGGCRAAASMLPFWAAACGTQSWPPSCRRRAPFRRARAVGAKVPPRGG